MTDDRYPPTKEHPEGKLKTPRPAPMPTMSMYDDKPDPWGPVFFVVSVVVGLVFLAVGLLSKLGVL